MKRKKIISIILALMMILSIVVMPTDKRVSAYSNERKLALNGQWVSRTIAKSDDKHYYKFVVAKAGYINYSLYVSTVKYASISLYKADSETYARIDKKNEISTEYASDGTASDPTIESFRMYLSPGVYYFVVTSYYTGNYKIKASYTSIDVNALDGNNSYETATLLNPNVTIKGHVHSWTMDGKTDNDYYKIIVPYSQNVTVKITCKSGTNLTIRWGDFSNFHNEVVGGYLNDNVITRQYTKYLKNGAYYLMVSGTTEYSLSWSGSKKTTTRRTNKMNISGYRNIIVGQGCQIKATTNPRVAQNNTWKSNAPSIATVTSNGIVYGRTPGKATIRVTAGDGTGVGWNIPIYVRPQMMRTPKVWQPNNNQVKLQFVQQTGVTGYQVVVKVSGRVNKTLHATVGSKTYGITYSDINKGCTYSVRVRSYKKCSDGKILYGTWSKAASVKTKN